MAERHCGASVYVCAARVAVLDQSGVPSPGAGNLYATDSIVRLELSPVYYQPPEIEVPNGCGNLCVTFKPLPVLKRWDLVMELCNIDPELEHMVVGGELFTAGGFSVGASSPAVGVASNINGVSVEAWSKHIVNGDVDDIYPYIHWVFPRTKWTPDRTALSQAHLPRLFNGFTSENPNWFNGPANDWTYASDRSYAWAFTNSIPSTTCGATALAST